MCGRLACTLDSGTICRACTYQDTKSGEYQQPKWREHPKHVQYNYRSSPNMAPTMFVPVMLPGERVPLSYKCDDSSTNDTCGRIIQPMMWGIIPPWHKGPAKSHGLSTNNARIETLLESKLYKRLVLERKFCIILAEGFYEWKTVGFAGKGPKQPFMIYMPQPKGTQIYKQAEWTEVSIDEKNNWNGPNILRMAGLYDKWTSPEGDDIFSFAVITMASNSTLNWLHDRMPAILETPEQVRGWIEGDPSMAVTDVLKLLTPANQLEYYEVSTKVNNSRCQDMDCILPLTETKALQKEDKSKSFMTKWLNTNKVKVKENVQNEPGEESMCKKLKIDPK